jgi:Uma2 family endonuclease
MSQVTDPPRIALEIDPRPFLSHPDARDEIVDGQVVELPEMGIKSETLASWIDFVIQCFLLDHPIGRSLVEGSFILDPESGLMRRPDVAFVSFDRWPADRDLPDEGGWQVVPELAIEVIRSNDLQTAIRSKVQEYFARGVQLVWLADPIHREVSIFTTPTRVHILTEADTLDGGDVLPGFSVPVARLFRRTLR